MTQLKHRWLDTHGLRMYIAEQGTGPLVLLLHGFPEGWYSWRHQLAALAEAGYHVVAPDQRGYGQTDRPADVEHYTQLHLVGDVVGLLDALGEETACVAGHDWGAVIAWSAALLRPDRVKAVLALSVPYTPRGAMSSLAAGRAAFGDGFYHHYFQKPGLAEAEFERDCRTTLRKFLYGASGDVPRDKRLATVIPAGQDMLEQAIDPEVFPSWLSEADIDHYATSFEQTGFTGGLNWYRMIERNWELMAPWHEATVWQPALFLAGDRDTVATSPRGQQQLATMQRFVPNLRATILLPGGGHWIQQEYPTQVTTAVLQFLQSL